MSLPLRQADVEVPDAVLAAAAARGDSDALGALYFRHAGGLGRLAWRLLGNRSEAEDVVQDLFARLPESLGSYREAGRLDGWLRRLAVNLALKRLRSSRTRRELPLERGVLVGAGRQDGESIEVRRAVEALPIDQRAVVVLKVVEGYSHEEIAEILGISRGASEVRLSRAMKRLREDLEP